MAATYTTNAGLKKPETGAESGTWGGSVNNNIVDMIDEALGYAAHSMPDTNDTITIFDGLTSTARAFFINVTGTLTANRDLNLAPNDSKKVWVIKNSTSGGFSLIIKQGSGSSVTIASGDAAMVYADGGGVTASVANAGLAGGGVGAGDLTGTVLASNVVTSSLTTVGTIGTGVWQGTQIADAYLAALSATKLTGTVNSARLTGAYTGITGLGTLTSLTVAGTSTVRDIVFAADSTYDIGSTGVRPANIYCDALDVAGTLTMGSINLGSDVITDMYATTKTSVGPFASAGYNFAVTGITLTGVAVGDVVLVKRATINSGTGYNETYTTFEARVTGANTISITASPDGAPWSSVVLDFELLVIKF